MYSNYRPNSFDVLAIDWYDFRFLALILPILFGCQLAELVFGFNTVVFGFNPAR
jgi:hypothetical protein